MTEVQHYAAPHSLAEAAEILRGGNVTILAGGTDVMPQSRGGRVVLQPTLMSLRYIPELRGVTQRDDTLRIGALTSITELLDNGIVQERLRVLHQACDHFASDQIRNAATIGGNICNASPAGDTLVPLLVLNAQAVLVSKPNGSLTTRSVPLNDFFTGPGKTKRASGELLMAVDVPLPGAGFVSEFFKFGTRPGLDISTIAIGFGAIRDKGVLRDVRMAFGAVAPTPIRAPQTEAALEGKPFDQAAIAAALEAANHDIHPISDIRASEWYRRELVQNILRRLLHHVRDH
jgi:xanthine dehydrogenase FAD-binding subunit